MVEILTLVKGEEGEREYITEHIGTIFRHKYNKSSVFFSIAIVPRVDKTEIHMTFFEKSDDVLPQETEANLVFNGTRFLGRTKDFDNLSSQLVDSIIRAQKSFKAF